MNTHFFYVTPKTTWNLHDDCEELKSSRFHNVLCNLVVVGHLKGVIVFLRLFEFNFKFLVFILFALGFIVLLDGSYDVEIDDLRNMYKHSSDTLRAWRPQPTQIRIRIYQGMTMLIATTLFSLWWAYKRVLQGSSSAGYWWEHVKKQQSREQSDIAHLYAHPVVRVSLPSVRDALNLNIFLIKHQKSSGDLWVKHKTGTIDSLSWIGLTITCIMKFNCTGSIFIFITMHTKIWSEYCYIRSIF